MLAFHIKLTLRCSMSPQADAGKNRWDGAYTPPTQREREKSLECRSVCVCTHRGMTEGLEEWFLGGDCKFQAWLLSISEALLSPSCPQCPASQRRCSETQHTKWDVTCAAILFYLYWMGRHWGRDAKKRSPAAWWGLGALQAHQGVCVIFTLTSKGVRETSSPSTTLPPLRRPRPPSPQRQRKTEDNYLVWNFLAVSVSATRCVGVTELIFDCGFEDIQQGYGVDACVGGALPGEKEQF